MDHVPFPLVLLSEPRDASRTQSGHSCSVTGTVLAAPAPLSAQVPRASRRCLPALETLRPALPGSLPTGAIRLITSDATRVARCARRSAGTGAVSSSARISEVPLDQRAQTQPLFQLPREQPPGIRGDRGAAELDMQLRIERKANRARCRVTQWVVPSASARSPREPRFMRALSDYGPLRSAFKSKMWAKRTDGERAMRWAPLHPR